VAQSRAFARIKTDLIGLVRSIPAGRLTTSAAFGRHIDAVPRHVANILATLEEALRDTAPWRRVVADGGAIGRHKRRE
jgi:methylated-DNA-protein-cysteine methyltransferase related protein